jgi:hypothetical protein
MSRGRRWTVALSVIAALAVAGGAYVVTRGWPGTSTSADASSSSAPGAGSSETPVPEPVEQTAVAPDAPNPSSGQSVATDEPIVVDTAAVPVVLSYSAWSAAERQVMAGGYVSGVIEDDGVCTLTLTQAGASVVVEGAAAPDATTTVCGGLTVPGSRLSAGTWQAVLTYASSAHTGTSGAVAVEVPA